MILLFKMSTDELLISLLLMFICYTDSREVRAVVCNYFSSILIAINIDIFKEMSTNKWEFTINVLMETYAPFQRRIHVCHILKLVFVMSNY